MGFQLSPRQWAGILKQFQDLPPTDVAITGIP